MIHTPRPPRARPRGARPAHLVLCCALAASCGGSSGTGTTQGGASGPAVQFGSTGAVVQEDGAPVTVEVLLSAAVATDVSVTVAVGGTATDGDDYTLDLMNLVIPAGDLSLPIMLTPMSDSVCEHPETVVFQLLAASGLPLGAVVESTTTILDADTEFLLEAESNDDIASANDVGALGTDRCLEIQGEIQEGMPDPFDVFEFSVPGPVEVDIQLRPLGGPVDLLMLVTDGTGAVILPPVQQTGPGEMEQVTFCVDPAMVPEINLVVSCFGPQADYRLSVIGAPVPLPLGTGSGSGVASPGWNVSWAQLKESLRPGAPGAAAMSVRPLGLGVALDPASGDLRQGVVVGRGR